MGSYDALVVLPTSLPTNKRVIADPQPDPHFDSIIRLVAELFEVPVAFLSIIDGRRHWFKSVVGLPNSQISSAASFCDYAIRRLRRPVVVEDASLDRRFADNPLVAGSAQIRSFAGISVSDPQGRPIGTIGIFDRQPRPLNHKDLAKLVELARVVESLVALHEDLQEATNAAIHDDMTGLANRAFFRRAIAAAVPGTQAAPSPCAVLYLDLDGFKGINDRCGHAVGDAILCEAAGRLAAAVRSTDFIARLGGDEFAILMTGVSQRSEIASVARRIIRRLANPFRLNDLVLSLSASIGIALSPEDATTVTRLVECADIALYAAKTAGRGCFRYYRDCRGDHGETAPERSARSPHTNRSSVIEPVPRLPTRLHDDRSDLATLHRKALAAIHYSRALLAKTRPATHLIQAISSAPHVSTLFRFTGMARDVGPISGEND